MRAEPTQSWWGGPARVRVVASGRPAAEENRVKRRSIAPTILVVLLSTVVLACGGSPPTGSGAATPPPAGGSLGARMPAQLGGQPVTYVEASGDQVATLLQTADAALLTDAVDDHRKPITSFKAAVGVQPTIV